MTSATGSSWGLAFTVNTQTGEYTVIRGIDHSAQCESKDVWLLPRSD
jgi:hypothetical protein